MTRSATHPRTRPGFTLVEMLTVVVIIGILASMITAAAIAARRAARRAVIHMEVNQLQAAAQATLSDSGDLPPDFTNATAVSRFLRKAFPRYSPGVDPFVQMKADVQANYGLDVSKFDPASALVFWLGGLPEVAANYTTVPYKPAGFHADPLQPFRPGAPRIKPKYDFNSDRVVVENGAPHYYPPDQKSPLAGGQGAPYVYFRAVQITAGGVTYWGYNPAGGQAFTGPGASGICVPYGKASSNAAADPPWRNNETCQIISAGLDGNYGTGGLTRITKDPSTFTVGDFDNITNFVESGTLEDEMK